MDVDRSLIQRLAAGEVAALEELYRRHGASIYRLCRQVLRQNADAEDAVQEVFLKVFERASQFAGRARFSTWLYRTAVNHCLHRLDRERVRLTETLETTSRAEVACGASPDPVESAQASEAREQLEGWMGRLSVEHRIVLHLREIEGATYEEIASALDVPKGTVMSRLARARSRLNELVGQRPRRDPEDSGNYQRNPFLRAVL
jgi:RNA polymerase sigma-70 factor (ECF subfamily)